MSHQEETEHQDEVERFQKDPAAWRDSNEMRYRCSRCHYPMLSLLPAEHTSGVCACGGLIEAHPENFQAPLSGGPFSLLLPDGSPNPASPVPERAVEVSRARERRNAHRAARAASES